MTLPKCNNANLSGIRCVALSSSILFGLLSGTAWAQDTPTPSTPTEVPVQAQKIEEPAGPEVDWRDALLTELTTLANALDKQQKYDAILRDKIDILNHRIEELEQSNETQAKRIADLIEAQSQSAQPTAEGAGSQVSRLEAEALEADPSGVAKAAPKPEDNKQANRLKPSAPSLPNAPSNDGGEEAPKAESKENMPEDFEQFLDMGEAMMRRFFGVVKEFRKEFDDNRV